ncbi:MAG: helix-turn-helix transcriptional regulator [Clostridia bacterium]|nr:helix-turn-helix transcriptional regulator [Clostridia bacterium]
MEITMKATFRADKLKEIRKKRGMTQAELAQKSGLNPRTLQDYEQGSKDLNNARLETILRLCVALNCKMIDIVNSPDMIELVHQYGE